MHMRHTCFNIGSSIISLPPLEPGISSPNAPLSERRAASILKRIFSARAISDFGTKEVSQYVVAEVEVMTFFGWHKGSIDYWHLARMDCLL